MSAMQVLDSSQSSIARKMHPSDKVERIAQLLTEIDVLLAQPGLKSFSPASLAFFSDCSDRHKDLVFAQFQAWKLALQAIPFKSASADIEAKRLKLVLDVMGFKIRDEVYSQLRGNDIVEAYLIDHTLGAFQIYRNANFRNACSYDLLMITSKAMAELFKRDETAQQQIEQTIGRLLQDGSGLPLSMDDVDEHDIIEILHSRQRRFRIKNRIAALLLSNDGKPVGFVSTLNASQAGSLIDDHVRPIC
jgi:hypothetical protein